MNAVTESDRANPSAEEVEAFYSKLGKRDLSPLWENMQNLAPPAPRSAAVPTLWKAQMLQEQLDDAIRLVTTEKAERRVLVLENRGMPGQSASTPSLYSGVQVLAGHERARSHRHTASALRLIISGNGGYTTVEGERAYMKPGDFIITPSWSYHDHGNDSDEPVVWLDGLDVFIVNLLSAAFGQGGAATEQPVIRPSGDALARYGQGVVPIDYEPKGTSSPLFYYPYERTKRALHAMASHGAPDPALGFKAIFTDPTTGASPIRTMSAFMQSIPAGFCGESYRSTDGAVFCVVEGSGSVRLGETTWDVNPHDIFVIPSWHWHALEARKDLVLFSFSDRTLQQHLGFWREQRNAVGEA
jgi:gentisate 1,2-dioxygenase